MAGKEASDSLLTLAPAESRHLRSIYLSMMAVARVTEVKLVPKEAVERRLWRRIEPIYHFVTPFSMDTVCLRGFLWLIRARLLLLLSLYVLGSGGYTCLYV